MMNVPATDAMLFTEWMRRKWLSKSWVDIYFPSSSSFLFLLNSIQFINLQSIIQFIWFRRNDTCTYHWGISFQNIKPYKCCNRPPTSDGCVVHKCHISNIANLNLTNGFVRTMPKATDGGVYALDCEMCYTTQGSEVTRVSVVSTNLNIVYETLVKPENAVLDHNTRFSGITEEKLQNVTTSLRDVQAILLNLFSNKTILIGHNMDSDLRALRVSDSIKMIRRVCLVTFVCCITLVDPRNGGWYQCCFSAFKWRAL